MDEDVNINCCKACNGLITTMEKLECFGCKYRFHVGCTTVSRAHCKIFMELDYAAYICKDCNGKEFIPKDDIQKYMDDIEMKVSDEENNEKKNNDVVRVSELSDLKNEMNEMKKSINIFMTDIMKVLKKENVNRTPSIRIQLIKSRIESSSSETKKKEK